MDKVMKFFSFRKSFVVIFLILVGMCLSVIFLDKQNKTTEINSIMVIGTLFVSIIFKLYDENKEREKKQIKKGKEEEIEREKIKKEKIEEEYRNFKQENKVLENIVNIYKPMLGETFSYILRGKGIFNQMMRKHNIKYSEIFDVHESMFTINLVNTVNQLTKEEVARQKESIDRYINLYESMLDGLQNKSKMQLIENSNIGKIYKALKEK
jgi:hypothetical protein